jgi:site-specific recombinase XerC
VKLYRESRDVYAVKQVLGHANVSITEPDNPSRSEPR